MYIGIDIKGVSDQIYGVDATWTRAASGWYLAAGMTQTGKVPPTPELWAVVQIFMDGFFMGVQAYNACMAQVEVLGYDPVNMEAAATALGRMLIQRQITETFMDNGADIVMPVAGNVGTGSAAVMEERGFGYIFGVDQDWTLTNSQYSAQILGSVLKKMDVPVYDTIKTLVEGGEFMPGNYILSFENGGTEFVVNSALKFPPRVEGRSGSAQAKSCPEELSSLSHQFLEAIPQLASTIELENGA